MMDWNRNGKIDMQDRFITHQIIHDKTDYNHIKNSKKSNSNSKIPAILVAIFVIMCVFAITNGIIVVTFWVADKVYFKENENSEHIIKNHNYEYNDNYKDDNNYGTSTYDSYNSQQSTQEKNERETEKYSNTTHSNSNDITEDPYNAKDYPDVEDFYYDNYYDFFDYEDAEDYYNEWAN